MSIQVVSLEFNGNPVGFCCPECGFKVFGENTQEGLCPHVIFVGEDISGQYQWNHEKFQKDTEKSIIKENNLENEEELEDILLDEGIDFIFSSAVNSISSSSAFALKVTSKGIACGPVASTVYAIIDYQGDLFREI